MKLGTFISLFKYLPCNGHNIYKETGLTHSFVLCLVRDFERKGFLHIKRKGRELVISPTPQGFKMRNALMELDDLLKGV